MIYFKATVVSFQQCLNLEKSFCAEKLETVKHLLALGRQMMISIYKDYSADTIGCCSGHAFIFLLLLVLLLPPVLLLLSSWRQTQKACEYAPGHTIPFLSRMTMIIQKWKGKQHCKVPAFKLHQSLGSDSETHPKTQDVLIRHENIKSTYLLKLQTQKPN